MDTTSIGAMHRMGVVVHYWEHLGMMDDPVYSDRQVEKLNQYMGSGIMPGVNLILTMETRKNPLTPEGIQAAIKTYLQ